MKRLLLSIASVLCLSVAFAQVPTTFSYQGILVDGTGAPVADGLHTVEFDFFTALSGGTQVYDGFTNNVTTYKGMFTFVIGTGGGNPVIPNNIWDSQVFLQVTADAVVLSPRVQLTSNPYAFKAESANTVVDNAVTSVKIVDGAVTSAKIMDGTIVAADLATDAVTGLKILDATITAVDLASDAVTSAKILDGTIATADLGAGSVTAAKLANTTVTANPYGSATQVATFTVDAQGRLTAAGNTTISGVAPGGTASGDLTGTYPGPTLNTGVVTSTKILDGTIAASDLATDAVTSAKILDGTIAAADLATSSVTSAKILDGEIVNADINASAAIADSKLATITTPGKVSADAITSGTLAGTLVGTGINATNVTTGTLPASVIPASVASGSGTLGQVGFWNGSNTLTGDAGYFWDNTNKRLGLGTVAPNRRLHIVGTGGLDDDALMEANGAGSNNSGILRFLRSQGTFTTPTSALAGDQLGSLTFAAHNGTVYTNGAEILSKAETTFSSSADAYLSFSTASAGSLSERMRITSGGLIGIGTTTPTRAVLEQHGAVATTNAIFGGSSSGVSLMQNFPGVGFNWYQNAGSKAIGTGFGGYLYFDQTLGDFQINTSTASAASANAALTAGATWRFKNNGNLGLGTTTPQSKLDVEGGAVIGATYSGTNAAPANGLLVEGNVGIGQTVLTDKLNVTGTTRLTGNTSINRANYGNVALAIQAETAGDYLMYANNSAGSNVFNVTDVGNVKMTGYIQLGDVAPFIKIDYLTGTTPATEGGAINVSIPNVTDIDKIISVSVLVKGDDGNWVGPGYTNAAEVNFNFYLNDATNQLTLRLVSTESAELTSNPFKVTVIYIQ